MSNTILETAPQKQQSQNFYVYKLSRTAKPDTPKHLIDENGMVIFYYGKGKIRRIHSHEWCARKYETCKHRPCRVIRKVWKEGGDIAKGKIQENLTEEVAHELEKSLIAHGRKIGYPLVNLTDGGEGVSGYSRYAGQWCFLSPDNTPYCFIENLHHFCLEHKLNHDRMGRVFLGSAIHHKGWTRYAEEPQEKPKMRTLCFEAFQDPQGNIHNNITDLESFCSDRNLGYEMMRRVYHGTQESHRGWTKYPPVKIEPKQRQYSFVGFVDPNGHLFAIEHMYHFCLEHGLDTGNMSKLANGKVHQYKGWTRYPCITTPSIRHTYHGSGFMSPHNEVFEAESIHSLSEFCREHDLCLTSMSKLSRGIVVAHKGWTKHHPSIQQMHLF